MTINHTTLLDLPLPVTGTESGTWGDIVNNGLSEYIDISVAGSLSLSADSDTNLSSTKGNAAGTNIGSTTAQYAILRCTGARTATRNINAPAWAISGGTLTNYSKIYIVVNETTGSQNIVLRATDSATPTYTTGVTIVPGERAVCAWNGSDFVKVGGAAGGSTTQVQYNNAGVFGGITNATTDGTTLSMTSPKVITSINDTNGNELLKVTATASAVNEVTVANAATGNNPVLSATGNDTNIGINLTPKGSGAIKLSGLSYPTADGSANQAIVTNGSGTLSFATISASAATPTALGTVYGSMTTNSSTYLTAAGYNAGAGNTGNFNTAFGTLALDASPSGAANNAFGVSTLGSNTTGASNSGFGHNALTSNTTGNYNVAVGHQALDNNTTGSINTAVGYQAARNAVATTRNVAIGAYSMGLGTSSGNGYNTAVGTYSLYKNSSGENNVAMGEEALYENTTGTNNTALGRLALTANTTANNNTGIGYQALYSNTTGTELTAVGAYALKANTTGISNAALGYGALYLNTTGNYNSAIGVNALYANTTGANNVAVGFAALDANTTAGANVGIGHNALGATTTGPWNVAVGGESLRANTTGGTNTAVGGYALYNCTTGLSNICVGSLQGAGINYSPVFDVTTENNRLVMGHSSITNAYVQVAWTVTSDARDKTNITVVPHGLAFVNQLNPVSFQFKTSREDDTPNGNKRYGFLAQDILALEGDDPVIIDNEVPEKLKYQGESLVPVLVKAVQELSAQVQALQAEIATLKGA